MSINSALKDPTTGAITVSAHALGGGLQLWAEALITRAQFISGAHIPSHAEADIDAMVAVYTAKANATLKLAYLLRAERAAVLLQVGAISAASFRTFMELV